MSVIHNSQNKWGTNIRKLIIILFTHQNKLLKAPGQTENLVYIQTATKEGYVITDALSCVAPPKYFLMPIEIEGSNQPVPISFSVGL